MKSSIFSQILSFFTHQRFSSLPSNIESELLPKLSKSAELIFPDHDAGLYGFRWSAFHQPTPAAIVVAVDANDIVETVKYAVQHHIDNFLVQNRGHGWDISLDKIQNGLYLSLSKFQDISIDLERNVVTAGAGVETEVLVREIHKVNKQLPVTSCYCPSQIGPTLGGGVGRFMGLYGMMLDNIVSAKVALSNGDVVIASEDENSDLFWALRGAGANFGVVLEATYKLHDGTPNGLIYNLDMVFSKEQIPEVFNIANEYELHPASSTALIYAGVPERDDGFTTVFFVNFVHVGPATEGRASAAPYLKLGPTILDDSEYPYDTFARNVAQKAVVSMCTPGRSNMFTVGVERYDIATQEYIFNTTAALLEKNPDARSTYVTFQTYSYQAVKAVPSESTAYAHREVNHHVLIVGRNQQEHTDQALSDWGMDVRDRLREKSNMERQHVHLNFARGDESLEAKYGEEWRLAKLMRLKRKYDPKNLFHAFHPIDPSGISKEEL